MVLWGSVGVFSRNIGISSSLLAFSRSVIALPIIYFYVKKDKSEILSHLTKRSIFPVIIAGALIGVTWLFLFIAFDNTSVANATFAYNMAPVYVMVLAPIILKEKLSNKKIVSIIAAFIGLFLIVVSSLNIKGSDSFGIASGVISGITYACIVLINFKFGNSLPNSVKTFVQLMMVIVVLFPIIAFQQPISQLINLSTTEVLLTLILGVFHTAIAYQLYFSCYKSLPATSVALYSYLDPVCAIIFGLLFFKEPLSSVQIFGGILILGSTLFVEL